MRLNSETCLIFCFPFLHDEGLVKYLGSWNTIAVYSNSRAYGVPYEADWRLVCKG